MAKVSQEDVEAALGNGIDSPEQTDDSKKDDKKVQENYLAPRIAAKGRS